MLVRILGPLGVETGREINLGGPKQRLLLALLALRANRAVAVDALIDDLWGEETPGRPRKALQVYVCWLRSCLDGPGRILTEPSGYRLVLAEHELDVSRFKRLVADARAAVGSDPVRAEGLYREALRLWPGLALPDLRTLSSVGELLQPLENLRAEVAEEHLSLRVRSGEAAAAVTELLELTQINPWRERPWALLMEAYYRSGRQHEALATYQRVRDLLADDLGVDPGPELRRMERNILRQDPGLAVAAPDSGAVAISDERRPATFVSLGIAGYDRLAGELDPEDLMAAVDAFRTEVREIVGQHGGAVQAVEEGRLLACFGYPVAAEDDLIRGVRAGLAAAGSDPSSRTPVSAGVHAGLAVFRTGPNAGVFGNTPALAATLQRAAGSGEVRISAETAALAGGKFEVSRRENSLVVVAEKTTMARGRHPDQLWGRDESLTEIRRVITARPGPAVVLLWGEAGIGKTAVAQKMVEELEDRQTVGATIVLQGDRHRRDQALHPIAEALAARHRNTAELVLAWEQAGMASATTAHDAALLSELAGWSAPAAPTPQAGAARRRAIVTWLTTGLGTKPLRLVVEDLHDVDQETRELLDDLVDELGDGAMLITSRTDDLPPRLAAVARRIRLDRLSRTDARALVVHTAGDHRLQTATVNQLVQRCAGSPLYLRELTLATTAAMTGTGDEAAEVPTSLQASLLARLDRLGPAKALAQRCAAIGAPFDRNLAALLGNDRPTGDEDPDLLDRELADLVSAEVLRQSGGHGEQLYTFSHALLEDCAYASLPRPLKAELHRRLAQWSPSSTPLNPGWLAGHLAAAGDSSSAAKLWVQAAQQAAEAAKMFEASTYARRALKLLPRLEAGGERDQLELAASFLLASSLRLMNFVDTEAHASASRARELANALGRTDLTCATDVVLISVLHGLGRFEEAAQLGATALSKLAGGGGAVLGAVLRQYHTETLIFSGRLQEAERLSDPEVMMSDSVREAIATPILGPAVATIAGCSGLVAAGLAAFTQDQPERCERLFERASRMARKAEALDAICCTDLAYSITRQLCGDVATTARLAESSMEMAIELGRDQWFIWSQVMLGWAVSASGNPQEGATAMTEALDHTSGSVQILPYFHAITAVSELAAGRPGEALTRTKAAVSLAERTGERLMLPYIHLVTANILTATAAPAAAVAEQRHLARDLAHRQGQRWLVRHIADSVKAADLETTSH